MSRSGRGTSRGVNKFNGTTYRSQREVDEALRVNLNRKARRKIAENARKQGFKAKVN